MQTLWDGKGLPVSIDRQPILMQTGKMHTHSHSILVVDDSLTQLALLQDALQCRGYAVETAQNGLEAITKVYHSPPSLILSDVVMPELNGYRITSYNVCYTKLLRVKLLEPTFGGINLEDIKGPECFYIEEKLKEIMNIPVFHDDQHGTAIIANAGLLNALEIV